MSLHQVFDIIAALASATMLGLVYRWRIQGTESDPEGRVSSLYLAALIAGAAIGAYGFGTANLALSGVAGIGRSILGALAGAIAAIEIYKRWTGIRGSTGLIFVAGFATSIAIGRIGCQLSGLDDETYGLPTGSSWGWDYGDGILRHPVALYESVTMAAFLAMALWLLSRRNPFFMRNGFYVLVAFYAGQRFVWEFLKPYAVVIGPFNLFHLLCLALIAYGLAMMTIGERRNERAVEKGRSVPVLGPDHLALRSVSRPGAGEDRHRGE